MTRVQYWRFQNLLKTSEAYVWQSGFSTYCFGTIKLKFDCAYILHKLDNLFICIIYMFMHVIWWNVCITTRKLCNVHVIKMKHMFKMRASKFYKIKRLQDLGNAYFYKMLKFSQIQKKILYYFFLTQIVLRSNQYMFDVTSTLSRILYVKNCPFW